MWVTSTGNMLWPGRHCRLCLICDSQTMASVGQHALWIKVFNKGSTYMLSMRSVSSLGCLYNICIHLRSYPGKSRYKHCPLKYLISVHSHVPRILSHSLYMFMMLNIHSHILNSFQTGYCCYFSSLCMSTSSAHWIKDMYKCLLLQLAVCLSTTVT